MQRITGPTIESVAIKRSKIRRIGKSRFETSARACKLESGHWPAVIQVGKLYRFSFCKYRRDHAGNIVEALYRQEDPPEKELILLCLAEDLVMENCRDLLEN